MARHLALNPSATSSVSLGFRCDEEFERTVRFARDPSINRLDIDGTCERCRLTIAECQDRAAPPILLELQRTRRDIERELESL
jgi:XRE family transcriptional regulator, fatty acid utilization regulator